jgi:DNA-binding MarR family transcriptional regulator
LGISLLTDWDLLAFVYRHGASLTSTDQIARLIGYESAVVGAALDRLERDKLIERSGPLGEYVFTEFRRKLDIGAACSNSPV